VACSDVWAVALLGAQGGVKGRRHPLRPLTQLQPGEAQGAPAGHEVLRVTLSVAFEGLVGEVVALAVDLDDQAPAEVRPVSPEVELTVGRGSS
jgi:hypothetical protein